MIDFTTLEIILAVDAFLMAIAVQYKASIFSTMGGLMMVTLLAATKAAGGVTGSTDYNSLFVAMMILTGANFVTTIGLRSRTKPSAGIRW